MSNEEALMELKSSIVGCGFQCNIETYELAIEALEKQTPKKPKHKTIDYLTFDICPSCDNIIHDPMDEYRYNYCRCCGQRIDWE